MSAAPRRSPSHDRVLQSAVEAFSTLCLDAVTLAQIARQAGVHRVTLHRAFPGGRDELVMEVVLQQVLRLREAIAQAIKTAPTCEGALLDGVTIVYEGVRYDKALAQLLARPETRTELLDPPAGPVRLLANQLWSDIVERARVEGRTTVELPDDDVVDDLLRIGVSLIIEPARTTRPDQMRHSVRHLVAPALIH